MRFIGNVIEKLQRHPKRVVFPEGEEPRILQAARQFHTLRLGAPIGLGDIAKIKEAAEGLKFASSIPPGARIWRISRSGFIPCAGRRACAPRKRGRR